MSALIWDTAQGQRSLGEDLNDFLYEDGKPLMKGRKPGTYKEHTIEEYREKLEAIRLGAWETYHDISKEMGWNE